MELKEKIEAALGERKSDLLLKNGRIIDVFSGEIYPGSVAVYQDRIVGLEELPAEEVIDLQGKLIAPGFIDGHVHIESSMVTVPEYGRAVVPQGTTTVIIDPHEIANVLGTDGIQYMIQSAKSIPLDVFLMIPSCVPATNMETAGALLSAADIAPFFNEPSVLGLGEMMNFPGVLFKDPEVLKKIESAHGKRIDGHAPGLSGKQLSAYISAGIRSDHECTTIEEAREKIRKGMVVLIREGTAAKNLEGLIPLVNSRNGSRFAFCTDDRHPADLISQGHINYLVKRSIQLGIDPVLAVRMATLNTAEAFGLEDRGAIAPGFRADLAVFDDFDAMHIRLVLKDGRIVAKDGKMVEEQKKKSLTKLRNTFNIMSPEKISLGVPAEKGKKIRVIQVIPNQIVTKGTMVDPKVENGVLVPDLDRDILKIVVIERHRATGHVGVGFVQGFGLRKGAIGSSVAHDSHNLIVVGTNDADMKKAAEEIVRMQGGLSAVENGRVVGSLALPVAGLLSTDRLEDVSGRIEKLKKVTKAMGCTLDDPFMQLSFLALPVIPELKITDRGLVDVNRFDFVPLFV